MNERMLVDFFSDPVFLRITIASAFFFGVYGALMIWVVQQRAEPWKTAPVQMRPRDSPSRPQGVAPGPSTAQTTGVSTGYESARG
jgi:hypothetical protein